MGGSRIRTRKRSGQSLVETALILPLLLLLLTGIIDFGLLFNSYLVISNASREGARRAVTGNTDAQIRAAVYSAASVLDPARLNITIFPDESVGRSTGDPVTVTVTYEYSMVTPIIGAFFPETFEIESGTTMRCE
ncbi:MAG TPA: TadE/TadG family type IV pilus assembly protein [Clostridiales bacterium]|nr:TadE/TadG family type IV pilus assembly protein [Clostridiales bacterium]HPV01611.1 TadE/TadG family type IV pilus assembly protein [Clostridiales bacterium]